MRSATTSITWHYNGNSVEGARQFGGGLIAQLIADAHWQMRPGWGGTINGAPSLMYHLVIAADGAIYQTADIHEILWHAGHQDANTNGLALHFPIGGLQQPTPAMLRSALWATDFLRGRFPIPATRIVGHQEWKHATACPGPNLMRAVLAYRAGHDPVLQPTPVPAGIRQWQVRPDLIASANVRQGPGTWFPVAGHLKPGSIVFVDVVKDDGEPIDGNSHWIHMAHIKNEQADLGFVSETLGTWVS